MVIASAFFTPSWFANQYYPVIWYPVYTTGYPTLSLHRTLPPARISSTLKSFNSMFNNNILYKQPASQDACLQVDFSELAYYAPDGLIELSMPPFPRSYYLPNRTKTQRHRHVCQYL